MPFFEDVVASSRGRLNDARPENTPVTKTDSTYSYDKFSQAFGARPPIQAWH